MYVNRHMQYELHIIEQKIQLFNFQRGKGKYSLTKLKSKIQKFTFLNLTIFQFFSI